MNKQRQRKLNARAHRLEIIKSTSEKPEQVSMPESEIIENKEIKRKAGRPKKITQNYTGNKKTDRSKEKAHVNK